MKEKARSEDNSYNSVWVVMDGDGYPKHPQAFKLAQDNDIRIAFSNIAFEYWFLLHFIKTTKLFDNADELIKFLRDKGHYPKYKKSDDHYARLGHLTDTAVTNAAWLRKQLGYDAHRGDKRYDCNPYTDVDELVSYLLRLQ